MNKRVLMTGGAGFIGSHVADELLAHGYRVRVLDILSPQVHGERAARPSYLHRDVELMVGDVCDPEAVRKALRGVDVVYHLAAAVGVGQSMYEISHYAHINCVGTARLIEAVIELRRVQRLIVASSMSIYGEGLYKTPDGRLCEGQERTVQQLRAHEWEVRSADGEALEPVPTPESKTPRLASVYALNKYDQERMCLMVGQAYDIPTVALRFFNVFGTRQSLSNPYTGVLAIFASRLMNNRPPLIFEDGLQKRDFVSVKDIAQACRLALEVPDAAGRVFNIGSGRPRTILDVARRMARVMGREKLVPEIAAKYRVGDIRHCFADVSQARSALGYRPRVEFDSGLAELAQWLEGQEARDNVTRMHQELDARGLAI